MWNNFVQYKTILHDKYFQANMNMNDSSFMSEG